MGHRRKRRVRFFNRSAVSYGFERGGDLQELSAMLGIDQTVSVPSPCYQVALPDHRITVYADPAETLEELRREFRREIDSIARCFSDLEVIAKKTKNSRIKSYLFRCRSAASFLKEYSFSRELTAFFDIQSRYFFQISAYNLPLSSFATLCRTPPLHLDGGFKKFGDQLYSIILKNGGEVRYNERASSLSFHNHSAVGIETRKGTVEANTILLNTLPRQQMPLLLVGLLEEVIPRGMSNHVLLLPEYSRPQEFMVISLNAQGNDVANMDGTKALTVSFASNKKTSNKPEDKQACLEQLARLIPFLQDFMFFAVEYNPGAGHAEFPTDTAMMPMRSYEAASLFYRTSTKNVFVLHDAPEIPLQAVATMQRNIQKLH